MTPLGILLIAVALGLGYAALAAPDVWLAWDLPAHRPGDRVAALVVAGTVAAGGIGLCRIAWLWRGL